MLKGINPILTGDLLKVLSDMGHADEIVVGDGNFAATGDSRHRSPIWVPSANTVEVVAAILEVFPLDEGRGSYGAIVESFDDLNPEAQQPIRRAFMEVVRLGAGNRKVDDFEPIPREEFHERAKKAFAIVATVDPRHYACFVLRKGALPDPTLADA